MDLFGIRLPLDPEAKRWALPPAALAILAYILAWPWLWVPALLVTIAMLGFFRDPHRRVPRAPGAVVSPADGKVDMIQANQDPEMGPVGGPCITIFLSVLNVHVNRAPACGVVESTRHRPGLYLNALNPASTTQNEANLVRMRHGRHEIAVNQIAGIIARRIVCRVHPGQSLERGQRIGMIRFGSRTQLFLPPGARVQVEVGRRVKGGETILAFLSDDDEPSHES
jgi:phosphatidylserine decarboxylase